ncbi:hypothetical protein LS68_009200 [Helicobacter sp. MIT 05-5293]|uniref:hypothetical protein n=1 Tax=unclassified Helicobacter TaxID=2593540 RepID=UPI00051DE7AD|nr:MULTISPECIES: hypothetical protein [unclassified Helicobacter]TLD79838.1 hypothetical protein LS68_009200 [Helicobacter sp. MIT 05-5293]TLD83864.1 hypothetical protein LS69_010010 [Helicobacter sp. MIT 05-5294]
MGNILSTYNPNPTATAYPYQNLLQVLQNSNQNTQNTIKGIMDIVKESDERAERKNKARDENNAKIIQEAQAQEWTNTMRFRDEHTNDYLANQYKDSDDAQTRAQKQKNLSLLAQKESAYLQKMREEYKKERGYSEEQHKGISDYVESGLKNTGEALRGLFAKSRKPLEGESVEGSEI